MILTMEELLGSMMPCEDEQDVELLSSSEDEEFGENEVLVQNLDPKAALKDLRVQLADLYDLELSGYKFWLQDSEELDDLSCLADHCIEDSGLVEVHFEIVIQGGIKKIIIFDVVRTSTEESSSNDEKAPEAESSEEKADDVTGDPDLTLEFFLEEIKDEPMDEEMRPSTETPHAPEEVKPIVTVKEEIIPERREGLLNDGARVVNPIPQADFSAASIVRDGEITREKSSPYKVATVSDAKMSEKAPVMNLSTLGGSTEPTTVTVTAVGPQPINISVPIDTSVVRKPVAPVIKRVIPEGVRPSMSESQGPSSSSTQVGLAKPLDKPLAVRLKQPAREGPRWVVDKKFLAAMASYNMSSNPRDWSVSCVLRWYLYVKARYNIEDKYDWYWRISGAGLYELTERQVKKMVPERCLQDFWTHLELMRKCNVIAFLQRFDGTEQKCATERYKGSKSYNFVDPLAKTFHSSTPQLWQFLLDLLSDYRYYDVVRWTNNYGQFKFINPIEAATIWGDRKKKPYMNYEKLSRAIRYYYEDKLIVKVMGQRFTYRFTVDLKPIIGFTSAELKRRVEETVLATRKRRNL